MVIALTIVHILICFFLVVVVLLQSGKAADLAGAFGGMGSQTAFGPRGSATVLSKATTIAAAAFMLTSLTLAILATRSASSTGSVLERQKQPAKSAPAKAGQPATPQPAQATPQPGQAAPQPSQPGVTPSVSVTREGKTTTVPLAVPPSPANQPPAGGQQPAPKK
ncbi:MAG TPA: preprotein translocase subunit SecG [Bryobacteraceae bacterium]|nr:preprotein translocase subunit SecG [Bryobacteraceae bacterium]